MNRRDFVLLLLAFVSTRALITLIGALAVTYLPANEGEQFTHLLDGGAALDMWYRQDAGFYASIATYGYEWYNTGAPAADLAFMPLYPTLVRLAGGVGCIFSPYYSTCATIGGILISNAALFGALLLLFELTRVRFGNPAAWRACVLLLISPISIFLSGVYTESLFLLLTLLVFWLLERDRFALAVVIACLAVMTRSVGVALYPALLWIAFTGTADKRIARVILAHLPPLLFGAYILAAGVHVGDPLAYFSTYETTWARPAGSFIAAFTVYFTEPASIIGWRVAWIDLIMTLGYLALAGALIRRAELRAWGIFALFALLIPIASGTLVGMPRFGAVIFPFYVLLALWVGDLRPRRAWAYALAYGGSAALALLFLVRFVTWGWIA